MGLSQDKKPIENDIPDKIMEKVSSFPSMPRAGVKFEQYEVFAEKTQSWMKELSGTLKFD